ncbi:MAG: 6-pyruvoyl-tetrahydropterin synthase-related protein [Vicinamibacteria bacterium]
MPKLQASLRTAGPIAFFLFLTVFLTWPLAARMGSGISTSPDSLLNLWALAWNYHVLPREPLSLFDANIFFPRQDTLAYSEHLFGVALLAAPAYLVTGNAVFAYNVAIALSFFFSGIGMYFLVHELTGNRWAGLASGVIYAAAPYRFLQLFHVQLLSYQWFPFVFLFLWRFLRNGRPRELAAVVIFSLLQILSCNYYAMYLALAFVLLGIVVLFVGRSTLNLKKLLLLSAGAAVIVVTAWPFFLPYERNRVEQGYYRRYQDVLQFSAEPLDYLRPSAYNKVLYVDYLPKQLRSEKALFPGALAIVLGCIGWTATRRKKKSEGEPVDRVARAFFLVLTISGFVLSLGPRLELGEETTIFLPYGLLYRHVPGFQGLRVPARITVLFLIGLGVFAGWGTAWLLRWIAMWRPGWQATVGGAVVFLLIFDYQTYSLARVLPPAPPIPPVYSWLATQRGDFGFLELPIHEDITKESIRMYYSTAHWKDLANGFSGWWPNDYWVLVGRMRYFPTSGILRFLERDVPVRLILIHYDEYPERQRAKLRQDMQRYHERMPIHAQFGSDVVYELLPDTRRETTGTEP